MEQDRRGKKKGKRESGDTPLLVPVHGRVVHLVDNDNELLHTGRLDKHSVLARLTTLLEPGLELALASRDDEDGDVGLSRA